MENLVIEKTIKTPAINFNYETGNLLLEGISIPEDTTEFYKPVLKWLQEYAKSPQPKTTLELKLEYFNTSTSVVLLNIFKLFDLIDHSETVIKWYFETDDVEMEEVGEDYQNIVKTPFEIISVEHF